MVGGGVQDGLGCGVGGGWRDWMMEWVKEDGVKVGEGENILVRVKQYWSGRWYVCVMSRKKMYIYIHI